MVRPDVVSRKVGRASSWLDDAEELLRRDDAGQRDRDLAVFYIFLAIQECVDLATHWASDGGWAPAEEMGGCWSCHIYCMLS